MGCGWDTGTLMAGNGEMRRRYQNSPRFPQRIGPNANIEFVLHGKAMPFDSAKDIYWTQSGTEIHQLLNAVGFKPDAWVVYTDCQGSIYAPEPFSRH